MKKHPLKYLVLLPFLLAVACSGRPRVIPNDTLSDIFMDMFLVNAYTQQNLRMNLDSIDVYEPVLNDYGYSTRDFTHTLANFTKRKSAKLGPVIDSANNKLDRMLASLNDRIETEKMIDSIADAHTRVLIYSDSLIRVAALADTARLTVRVPVGPTGRYEIKYSYRQDTSDMNTGLQNRHTLYDAAGQVVTSTVQRVARSHRSTDYSTMLDAGGKADSLEVRFAGYAANTRLKPDFTVELLDIYRYPAKEEARKEFMRKWFDPRIVIDGKEYGNHGYIPENSGALRLPSPYLAAPGDSIPGE